MAFVIASNRSRFESVYSLLYKSEANLMAHLDWREAYENAVMETDPVKLHKRIEVARKAIHERLEKNEPMEKRESEDLVGALQTLRILVKQAA